MKTRRRTPFLHLSPLTPKACGRAATLLGLLGILGCNEHPLDVVEMESQELQPIKFDFSPRNKVDVLLVLDNSGSMGEEQANLAENFGAFVGQLELAGADYRLAVTTTDVGNPWCAGTTPEFGAMQATSCRERLSHFVSQSGAADVTATACTDICPLEQLALQATTVAGEDGARARPWLQAGGTESNLPEGVDAATAFRCMGPQGIDGCGFESPLEALRRTLQLARDPMAPEYGFLRDDAMLSVIIVTDEVDCSVAPGGEGIFASDGQKAFWSDPDDAFPTSAVCWNAGVRCEGDASGYNCDPADQREDGSLASAPDEAVLRPVGAYIEDVLAAVDVEGHRGVHVALLGGVPADLDAAGIPYADSPDPQFQHDYGIGAGCVGDVGGVTQTAVPPVRLRDFANAFAQEQLFSVCESDYTSSLEAVVEAIGPVLNGGCIEACVRDDDPVTPGVQPECTVIEASTELPDRRVVECEVVDGEVKVPAGEPVCVLFRGDADGSATPGQAWDDAGPFCGGAVGRNVAIEIYRAPGEVAPEGSTFEGSCTRAQAADATCE